MIKKLRKRKVVINHFNTIETCGKRTKFSNFRSSSNKDFEAENIFLKELHLRLLNLKIYEALVFSAFHAELVCEFLQF